LLDLRGLLLRENGREGNGRAEEGKEDWPPFSNLNYATVCKVTDEILAVMKCSWLSVNLGLLWP